MTAAERTIESLRLRLKLIDELRGKIEQAQDQELIDDGYAELRLEDLSSREADLNRELDDLDLTQPIANPPSAEDVERLAQAVADLRNWNVEAAALQGIIIQTFTLVGIALNN